MTNGSDTRARLNDIIFGHATTAGRAFDVALIISIVASVILVMLDSVRAIHQSWGGTLYLLEWGFTIVFTVEYALRLYSAPSARRYAFSFFGVVDFLSILPTYLSLLVPGTQYLLVIRVLRVLRVYRVLKLIEYLGEANLLLEALREGRRKITVFLVAVFTLTVVLGSLMYLVEGETHGFTSIPRSLYWTIVTLTTVGYGDVVPQTTAGQTVASVIMLLGYAIIAVPTGIVTVELSRATSRRAGQLHCSRCGGGGHEPDSAFCRHCGASLGR